MVDQATFINEVMQYEPSFNEGSTLVISTTGCEHYTIEDGVDFGADKGTFMSVELGHVYYLKLESIARAIYRHSKSKGYTIISVTME